MTVSRWKSGILVLVVSLLFLSTDIRMVSAGENHDQLFVYIGDSLMKVKSGDLEEVSKNIERFEQDWKTIKTDSESARKVDDKLSAVKRAVRDQASTDEIKNRLSALSSTLVIYDTNENPVDKTDYKERLQAILPLIDELDALITEGDFDQAKVLYTDLLNQWTGAEVIVREKSVATYGEFETKMAFVRIAITQDPPDSEKAQKNLTELKGLIEDFLAGKVEVGSQKNTYSLGDVTQLLQGSASDIEKDDIDSAVDKLNEILTIWPNVEGEVSTRDSKLYGDMETKVPTAISLLQSKNVKSDEARESYPI